MLDGMMDSYSERSGKLKLRERSLWTRSILKAQVPDTQLDPSAPSVSLGRDGLLTETE